jgi:glutamate racemase
LKSHSIGVFDSGFGGLTVLKEITTRLPEYDYIYLGDNARAPYGCRSFETVYKYTLQAVNWLFNKGCFLIILACNTASAKALRTIQQKDLPAIAPSRRVLGVIRPVTEIIGTLSSSGHIGILATAGTVKSNSYLLETAKSFPNVTITQQACPLLVPLIENNEFDNEGAAFFINKYLSELLQKDQLIDTIILGCTHYPLIINGIKAVLPSHIKVISQGTIVAESLDDYLRRHPEIENQLGKNHKRSFFTTDTSEMFNDLAELFYGENIFSEHAEMEM